MIFGVGALGSVLAVWFAKAGVPALTVVDGDRLRPGNLVRHAAGLFSVGHLKTAATALAVSEHVPDCVVEPRLATWNGDSLRGIINDATVVVDTAAVPSFSLLLNEICVALGKPLITAAAFRRAQIGRVRIIRPRRDACVMCYEAGYVSNDDTYPVIPSGDLGTFFETGCGVPTVEATAIDADAITNVAARAVLRVLRARSTGDAAADAPNHTVGVNEAISDEAMPFSKEGVRWTRWAPRTDCVVCGDAVSSATVASAAGSDAAAKGDA